MKRSWILILLAAIAIVAVIALWSRPNPPYTIEIRHVASDGAVTYEPQRYEQWNHAENIAGLRWHTPDLIYHSVYFDGLRYSFFHSGTGYPR